MQSNQAQGPGAVISPQGLVRVTVTTVRYLQPGGEIAWQRESVAEGDFATALQQTLGRRLNGWAVHQVFGRVLARRPARGQSIEYEGMFSDLRHVLILVQPILDEDSAPITEPEHVEIPGLGLPAQQPEALPAAA
jgi:hypothetical protein